MHVGGIFCDIAKATDCISQEILCGITTVWRLLSMIVADVERGHVSCMMDSSSRKRHKY
jgi:hypothetical protein